jgi:tRNA A37 N6-isopentenylltransferase MiaA
MTEAIARIKQGTRRFVQQQYNWFRPADPAIHWVDPGVMGTKDLLVLASGLPVRV